MSALVPRDEGNSDRRSGADRRAARLLQALLTRYRRRYSSGRRDHDCGYVDFYDGRTWAVALSVLALSFCDSLMTVLQVSQGTVREGNPLLYDVLLNHGPWAFFGIKAGVTAIALAVIVLHKEWRFGRLAARTCLWIYIGISLYHAYLVFVHSSLGKPTIL